MAADADSIPLVYALLIIGLLAALAVTVIVLQFLARRRIEAALAEAQEGQQAIIERAVAAETRTEAQEARLLDLRKRAETDLAERAQQIAALEEELKGLHEVSDVRQREAAAQRDSLYRQLADAKAETRELTHQLEMESTQAQEKLQILMDAREQMSAQFKALASELLEEKSQRFTAQNQENLGALLNPLREKIIAFQSKVEEVYVNEGKDRSALAEQVKMLTQLNNTLSQDTQNLTLALKGDRKAQGNFGEIILDDVLEKAGLMRGQHYERQSGVGNAEGQGTSIPDVVIKLPGERFLVVDSKMTLPDYRAFAEADSDSERVAALKRHLASVRKHIKGLSEKQYQTLYDLKSLDFVVMFVPLEPAFTMAVTNDPELFQHAWEKNVLLVSPSTLLFVVRTVANLWRQEDLSRNAKDISARGAELYDRLVGFVTDLNRVGERIQQAQDSFFDARKKLSEGSGNVIRQAEMLKKLGVKPSKALPTAWTEASVEPLAPPPSANDQSADPSAQPK
jgi:DNA recombination protein RmuC